MNILRRLPLYRLLLSCALAIAIGVSATALAFALGAGPTPPPKPLAQAVHDALVRAGEEPVQGLSANVTWTNHLLEGANLASGHSGSDSSDQGGATLSGPLFAGASGRLWIARDGRARLELQSEAGDTQVLYDGHTLQVYDAASNTLYRYTPQRSGEGHGASEGSSAGAQRRAPSVVKIEEALSRLQEHAVLSPATPTDVAGQPAYTVRVSPKQGGSLLGGEELSFDAENGVPLRAAVYSSTDSSPVMELAASEVSFGPLDSSVFAFAPPANAKVEEVVLPRRPPHDGGADGNREKPKLTTHGEGPATVAVLESRGSEATGRGAQALEGMPKVTIDGVSASELRTALGTLLTFERAGVRYVVAGAVSPTAVEEVARGL